MLKPSWSLDFSLLLVWFCCLCACASAQHLYTDPMMESDSFSPVEVLDQEMAAFIPTPSFIRPYIPEMIQQYLPRPKDSGPPGVKPFGGKIRAEPDGAFTIEIKLQPEELMRLQAQGFGLGQGQGHKNSASSVKPSASSASASIWSFGSPKKQQETDQDYDYNKALQKHRLQSMRQQLQLQRQQLQIRQQQQELVKQRQRQQQLQKEMDQWDSEHSQSQIQDDIMELMNQYKQSNQQKQQFQRQRQQQQQSKSEDQVQLKAILELLQQYKNDQQDQQSNNNEFASNNDGSLNHGSLYDYSTLPSGLQVPKDDAGKNETAGDEDSMPKLILNAASAVVQTVGQIPTNLDLLFNDMGRVYRNNLFKLKSVIPLPEKLPKLPSLLKPFSRGKGKRRKNRYEDLSYLDGFTPKSDNRRH